MAKWDVALYGHYKPNYYLRAKSDGLIVETHVEMPTDYDSDIFLVYEVQGNERRNVPGDVVSCKPYGKGYTELERKQFLCIVVDGPDRAQMIALCEEEWDLGTYREYNPLTFDEWYIVQVAKMQLLPVDRAEKGYAKLEANKTLWYEQDAKMVEESSVFPTAHWKKRRFQITLDELVSLGVDTAKMLDPELLYVPDGLEVDPTTCQDKLRQKAVQPDATLKTIDPRTKAEIESPEPIETILARLRS